MKRVTELPAYVKYAFSAIEVLSVDDEYQWDFARRWGGLSLAIFARALREGDRHDQQVSAFAIGYSESAWARDLLLPVLHSEFPEVRWAAALMLGQRREEAAFPVLIKMLQEFLPPHGSVDHDWYDVQHMHVARLLGSWGKREAIQPLHDTLALLWQVEQQRPPYEDVQMWSHYQDAMVYALGQLEAFDVLDDLDVSPERKRFWMVTLVMGYPLLTIYGRMRSQIAAFTNGHSRRPGNGNSYPEFA